VDLPAAVRRPRRDALARRPRIDAADHQVHPVNLVVSAKYSGAACHLSPKNKLIRLTSTIAFGRPISCG